MSVFWVVFIGMLGALGVALMCLELYRRMRAKKASFVCLTFGDEFTEKKLPDMLIICRTDAEQEEIIKRVVSSDPRKVYIKFI